MSRDLVHSISDIKYLAEKNNMPLEKMRFFIGEDYREPRAFGIYQDNATGEFVVYKNKDTGERVERYRGFDEEFAAQELWEKMESEINYRIEKYNSGTEEYRKTPIRRESRPPSRKSENPFTTLVFVLTIIIIVIAYKAVKNSKNRHNGYYSRDNSLYYYQGGDWYYYDDDLLDWEPYYDVDDEEVWFDNYYTGDDYYYYDNDYVIDYNRQFENSDYYSDYDSGWDWDSDSGDSWDWGSDNDWGGWDAGDTDWGSDW